MCTFYTHTQPGNVHVDVLRKRLYQLHSSENQYNNLWFKKNAVIPTCMGLMKNENTLCFCNYIFLYIYVLHTNFNKTYKNYLSPKYVSISEYLICLGQQSFDFPWPYRTATLGPPAGPSVTQRCCICTVQHRLATAPAVFFSFIYNLQRDQAYRGQDPPNNHCNAHSAPEC